LLYALPDRHKEWRDLSAERGQLGAGVGPMKQPAAQFRLEHLYCFRQGRLRDATAPRRARKIAVFA
jgi:hypothetical protein